jgi:rare lipoprotein A
MRGSSGWAAALRPACWRAWPHFLWLGPSFADIHLPTAWAQGDTDASSIYSLDTVLSVPDAEEDVAGQTDGLSASGPGLSEGVEIARGAASWYGGRFHGRRTASGERFDMYALTAAHPTLPFGTRIKVRRLDTGQEIEVRINDRGPHARGRILDLSRGAAQALGVLQAGESNVALVRP